MKINDFVMGSDIFIKECDITKVDSSHPFYEQNNLFIYTHSCPTDEIAYFKIPKVDIEMRLDSLVMVSTFLLPGSTPIWGP